MNRLSGLWNPYELLYSGQKLILTLITESRPACDRVFVKLENQMLSRPASLLWLPAVMRLDLVTQVIFAPFIFLKKEH